MCRPRGVPVSHLQLGGQVWGPGLWRGSFLEATSFPRLQWGGWEPSTGSSGKGPFAHSQVLHWAVRLVGGAKPPAPDWLSDEHMTLASQSALPEGAGAWELAGAEAEVRRRSRVPEPAESPSLGRPVGASPRQGPAAGSHCHWQRGAGNPGPPLQLGLGEVSQLVQDVPRFSSWFRWKNIWKSCCMFFLPNILL